MKGVMIFGKKGKLSPHYIEPYQIVRTIGKVAYDLDLPSKLEGVHPVFHVSMLKKFLEDTALAVPVESMGVKDGFLTKRS